MVNLPRVVQRPTPNYTPTAIRHDLVICHRTEGGYDGAVAWLCQPAARASAHLVMKLDGSEISQLVPLNFKAWAQCQFNNMGVSLEIEGYTRDGLSDQTQKVAAGVVAWLCAAYGIPPTWAQGGMGRGVCQHHDLGVAGGGHIDFCGVGSQEWLGFMEEVHRVYEVISSGPLPPFALHGLPNPGEARLPPVAQSSPSHSGADRSDMLALGHPTNSKFPHGSVADLQWRLNAAGAFPPLKVDGFAGPATRDAIAHFQASHGLYIDGQMGPMTWAKLDGATG